MSHPEPHGQGEEGDSADEPADGAGPARDPLGRSRDQREHEVERGQHPVQIAEVDFELAVDRGQREHRDRRVRQHEPDGEAKRG